MLNFSLKKIVIVNFFSLASLIVLNNFSCCALESLEPDPYIITEEQRRDFERKIYIDQEKSIVWQLRDYKPDTELHFTVIIPSYNNSKWYKKNLDSIFMQKYENYHIIYIDDASPDGTGNLVEEYVKERGQSHKVTIIKNKERSCSLANIYKAVYMCDDTDIIASCDGDDWWCSDRVLETLNKVYQSTHSLITYGREIFLPSMVIPLSRKVPDNIIEKNAFRPYKWLYSGLRSYYAWLFKKIKVTDLMFKEKFIAVSGDAAYFFPLLEMAGFKQTFIPDIFYVANRATGLNDFSVASSTQKAMGKYLRSRPKYEPL